MDIFTLPVGAVVLHEPTGLLTQIIYHEVIEPYEGKGEYRVVFTYPSTRLSNVVLKDLNPENQMINIWRNAHLQHMALGKGAYVPNFSFTKSCEIINPDDLGSASIFGMDKGLLYPDYLMYDIEEKPRKILSRYKCTSVGPPILKQIMEADYESTHVRIWESITKIVQCEPQKTFAQWLKDNILYSSYRDYQTK